MKHTEEMVRLVLTALKQDCDWIISTKDSPIEDMQAIDDAEHVLNYLNAGFDNNVRELAHKIDAIDQCGRGCETTEELEPDEREMYGLSEQFYLDIVKHVSEVLHCYAVSDIDETQKGIASGDFHYVTSPSVLPEMTEMKAIRDITEDPSKLCGYYVRGRGTCLFPPAGVFE